MADAEVDPTIKDSESTDKSDKKTKKKTSTKKTKDSTKEKRASFAEPAATDAPAEDNVPKDKIPDDEQMKTDDSAAPTAADELDDAAPEDSQYYSEEHQPAAEDIDKFYENLPIVEHPLQLKSPMLLEDIDENKLTELQEAFLLFDLNQDGYIDKNDLISTYKSLGVMDISEAEVTRMLAEAQCPMDFDSFVTLLGYKTIELDSEDTLIDALSKWDKDCSGLISEDQIRHDLMTWGDRFSIKEVDYALEDAPVYFNKKGKPMIDYINFCKSLSGLRKKKKAAQPPPEEGNDAQVMTESAPNA